MLISEIPWSDLVELDFQILWGANNIELERKFFKDTHYIYKLWSSRYIVKDLIIESGKYVTHHFNNIYPSIPLIDLGFVTNELSDAFVDLIVDMDGIVCGYVTKIGIPLIDESQITDDFFHTICNTTIHTGFAHTDFSPKNIISIDGKLSLIDFDSLVSRVSNFDLKFELMNGSLRPHVYSKYRLFLLDQFFKVSSK